MRRSRFRPGDYLVVDDESGYIRLASQTAKQWDGLIKDRAQIETRNPQEFVRARPDAPPPKDVRPLNDYGNYCPDPFFRAPAPGIGSWTIGTDAIGYRFINKFRSGLGANLVDFGVGGATVGCTLTVFPTGWTG